MVDTGPHQDTLRLDSTRLGPSGSLAQIGCPGKAQGCSELHGGFTLRAPVGLTALGPRRARSALVTPALSLRLSSLPRFRQSRRGRKPWGPSLVDVDLFGQCVACTATGPDSTVPVVYTCVCEPTHMSRSVLYRKGWAAKGCQRKTRRGRPSDFGQSSLGFGQSCQNSGPNWTKSTNFRAPRPEFGRSWLGLGLDAVQFAPNRAVDAGTSAVASCSHVVHVYMRSRMMRAPESGCERWGSLMQSLWDPVSGWSPHRIESRLLIREAGFDGSRAREDIAHELVAALDSWMGKAATVGRKRHGRKARHRAVTAYSFVLRRRLREHPIAREEWQQADSSRPRLHATPFAAPRLGLKEGRCAPRAPGVVSLESSRGSGSRAISCEDSPWSTRITSDGWQR